MHTTVKQRRCSEQNMFVKILFNMFNEKYKLTECKVIEMCYDYQYDNH